MGQEMKVISFNIRYNSWNNIDGENGWIYRRAAVVMMVDEERPAAIGLQEALIDQLRYLDSCLPAYRRVGVGRDDGKEEGEFMAVYYDTTRLKPTACSFKWLSEHPDKVSLGWDAACRRYVTIVRFRDLSSGKVFDFMNTHLDHIGVEARTQGVKLTKEKAASFNGKPVVCTGDFNIEQDTDCYVEMVSGNMADARKIAAETDDSFTFHGFKPGKIKATIDFVFVDKNTFKALKFKVINKKEFRRFYSDHYAVYADLELIS